MKARAKSLLPLPNGPDATSARRRVRMADHILMGRRMVLMADNDNAPRFAPSEIWAVLGGLGAVMGAMVALVVTLRISL